MHSGIFVTYFFWAAFCCLSSRLCRAFNGQIHEEDEEDRPSQNATTESQKQSLM